MARGARGARQPTPAVHHPAISCHPTHSRHRGRAASRSRYPAITTLSQPPPSLLPGPPSRGLSSSSSHAAPAAMMPFAVPSASPRLAKLLSLTQATQPAAALCPLTQLAPLAVSAATSVPPLMPNRPSTPAAAPAPHEPRLVPLALCAEPRLRSRAHAAPAASPPPPARQLLTPQPVLQVSHGLRPGVHAPLQLDHLPAAEDAAVTRLTRK